MAVVDGDRQPGRGLFQATGQQQPHLTVAGMADDEVVEPVDGAVESSLFLQDPGETLDVLATVGVDSAGGFQMRNGLVHQLRFAGLSRGLAQQHAEVVVNAGGLHVTGPELPFDQIHRRQVVVPRVIDLLAGIDEVGQLVVCQPAARVSGQGVSPQPLRRLVDADLLPGQPGQQGDQADRGNLQGQTIDVANTCRMGQATDDQGNHAGQGDVLVVIGNQ